MSENKLNPSKRLKNWHRKGGLGLSLRSYAAALRRDAVLNGTGTEMAAIARTWLVSKGLRP